MLGTLSVVATPIGNLEDITLRALRVLKEADCIAAEDTRVTKKLLARYEISARLVSFHANSGERGYEKILELLGEGKHVALVCDAGTPGISDPGGELAARAREAGARVEAIPGASALTAALSIAGLRAQHFAFYGFLPLKKGRESLLASIANAHDAGVFYESTHRILKTLKALERLCPERRMGLYRELTKLHEEALVGLPGELYERLTADAQKQRGEFVVILESR